MQKQIWIHIGPPKTGTSAIQKWLLDHRQWLSDNGIMYPEYELGPNGISSGHVNTVLTQESDKFSVSRQKVKNLLEEFERTGYQRLLLSSEHFFYHVEELAEVFPHAHFLAYVRCPIELYESIYNQSVKRHGKTQPLVFGKNLHTTTLDRLSKLADSITGHKFYFRAYLPSGPGFNLVQDFLSAFNLSHSVTNEKTNWSYTYEALETKRWLNQFECGELGQEIDAALQEIEIGTSEYSLLPETFKERHFKQCIQTILRFHSTYHIKNARLLIESINDRETVNLVDQNDLTDALIYISSLLLESHPKLYQKTCLFLQSLDVDIKKEQEIALFTRLCTNKSSVQLSHMITRLHPYKLRRAFSLRKFTKKALLQSLKRNVFRLFKWNEAGLASQTNGVVERLTRKSITGWLVLKNGEDINIQHFLVFNNFKNWVESVELSYRPGLSHLKKNNLFGFRIKLQPGIRELDKTTVFYVDDGDLYVIPALSNQSVKLACKKSEQYFLNRVSAEAHISGISVFQPHLIAQSLNRPFVEFPSEFVSEFLIPAGIKSPCGAAVTGKNGNLYLFGGANHVDQLFQENAVLDHQVAELWVSLIARRFDSLRQLEVDFVQMVIPEKQSVLPLDYYRDINKSSLLLSYMEDRNLPGWFSAHNALKHKNDHSYFFKTDSHLNSRGAYQLFSTLLKYLELPPLDHPKFISPKLVCGDLGRKFSPYCFSEEDSQIVHFPKKVGKPQLVESTIPVNKAHSGRIFRWVNPNPVNSKKVVVFGNSFFEKGNQSHQLTWWFAHYFAEITFVWSSDMNIELVKKLNADLVICQTIERFAGLVPNV